MLLVTVTLNKWIIQKPTAKQIQALLLDDVREVFYGGAAAGGKRLSIDTPIATPCGWTTMGELRPRDALFDDQGHVCHVIHAFPIEVSKQSFLVEFSDGSSIEADAEHLWRTFTVKDRDRQLKYTDAWRAQRRSTRVSRAKQDSQKPWVSSAVTERNHNRVFDCLPPEGSVRTTGEIAATLYVRGDRLNHSIPLAQPLDLPEAVLPVSPYLLGLWLGDGWSSSGCIGMAASDWNEILPFVREPLQSVRDEGTEKGRKSLFRICRFLGLTTSLRRLGILGAKRIPMAYQRASVEQRRELLRGLLDTDGHCDKRGSIEISLSDRALAEDVQELLTGLGVKATINTKSLAHLPCRCRDSHRMKFLADFKAFKLSRKSDRQKFPGTRSPSRVRYIVAVKPIAPRAMRCITVDSPSKLFLAGKTMVPTHNSSWILMEALKYVNVPGYAAIIFRKTLADLALPGALMDRAHGWLQGTEAEWSAKTSTWTFPSGATLSFAYLANQNDHYRYKSSEFQFVGFDELTRFEIHQYLYLFSRLRRLRGAEIPIRMRSASNPGDIGHEWVKERFITAETTLDRRFVPAFLSDNPHVDQEEYIRSLDNLDPITRAQLLAGNWDDFEGGRFRSSWFRRYQITENTYDLYKRSLTGGWTLLHSWPRAKCWHFGTCDPAASEKNTADYTAAGAWAVTPTNDMLLLEVVREHLAVENIVPMLKSLHERHGLRYVAIESVAFQKMIIVAAQRSEGMPPVRALDPLGEDKLARATPAIIRAEAGQFYLPEAAPWLQPFLSELVRFTGIKDKDPYDDQVDMAAWAALEIDRMGSGRYPDNIEKPNDSRLQPTHDSRASRRNLFGVGNRR